MLLKCYNCTGLKTDIYILVTEVIIKEHKIEEFIFESLPISGKNYYNAVLYEMSNNSKKHLDKTDICISSICFFSIIELILSLISEHNMP